MPAAEDNTRRSLPLLPIAVVGIVAVILAVAITFHTYSQPQTQPQPYDPSQAQAAHKPSHELSREDFEGLVPSRMRIDQESNAAHVYVTYGHALQGFQKRLNNLIWDELMDDAWLPDEEAIAVFALLDPIIDDILEATRFDRADFAAGVRPERHKIKNHINRSMQPVRTVARHLVYDARRHMAEGDPDAAAERLAAVFRLSWHLIERKPLVVPSLTASATFGLAMHSARIWAEEDLLTAEGVARIREAIKPYDPDDPFRLTQAWRNEGRLPASDLQSWLEHIERVETIERDRPEWADRARAQLKLELEDRVSAAAYEEAYERGGEQWLQVLPDVLTEYWDGYERFKSDIADAIEDEDRIAELVQARDAGEYGPVAPILDEHSSHQYTHGAFMRTRETFHKLLMALDAADRGGD